MTAGPALPHATEGEGPALLSTWSYERRRVWTDLPNSHFWLVYQHPVNEVSSAVQPRQDAGSNCLSAGADRGGLAATFFTASGRVNGGYLFLTFITTEQMRGVWPAIPLPHTQGQFTCTSINKVNFTLLPREGSRLAFGSAAADMWEGQLLHQSLCGNQCQVRHTGICNIYC